MNHRRRFPPEKRTTREKTLPATRHTAGVKLGRVTSAHLTELGAFLKARRAELSPRAVGLHDDGGPRRVPGLRREEVAQLAAISTDYYTRLEQGRMPPSASVLAVLAPVLRLSDDQRDYLFELAGKERARPRRRAGQKVQPQLRRLLDDLSAIPGMVLGRRMDDPRLTALVGELSVQDNDFPAMVGRPPRGRPHHGHQDTPPPGRR